MKLNITSELLTKFIDTFIVIRKFAGADPILCWIQGSVYSEESEEQVKNITEDASIFVRCSVYDYLHDVWGDTRQVNLVNYIVDFSIPDLGYVNTDDGTAVYSSRLPRKQWKRSLAHRQITSGIDKLHHKPKNVEVEQYFFPSYPTLQRAIMDVIDGTRSSVAINKEYAIGCMAMSRAILLYKKTVPVGVIVRLEGKLVCRLVASSAYLLEDIEQFLTCEVYENAT